MGTKLLLVLTLVSYTTATVKLREMYSWNYMDWAFPDQQSRMEAINSGELKPENALPVGIERWNHKLFVSVPRWRSGIPATLNYIPLDAPYDPSPKLIPYPSWQANELGNCASGLTTVYRIKADKCDRLWVLDVGTYGYENVTQVCPYSINIYDLNTDKRIRRYVFRPEDIVPTTFIANIALDIRDSCDDAFAYFPDELGYGLIVYSWEQNKSWRFTHSFFMPDPLKGDFNIAGLNFQWGTEGIFGTTAGPIGPDGYRTLYFSPLTSHTQFAVSTRVLRNESKVEDSYHDFKVIGDRGPNGHTTAHVMSESGIKLFNLIDQNAVGCWNSERAYKPQNIAVVDKDDIALIFPCDVKIVNENEVWVISDRMSTFLEGKDGLDFSDVNFRIFVSTLDELVAGTVCEPSFRVQAPVTTIPQGFNQPYITMTKGLNQPPFNSMQTSFNLQQFPQKVNQPLMSGPNSFTYYDSRFSQTPSPPTLTQYIPQPQAPATNHKFIYNAQGPPRVSSTYINFPSLQAAPLRVSPGFGGKNHWWKTNYEVYESKA